MKSKDGIYSLPGMTLRHGRLLRNRQTKRQALIETAVNMVTGAILSLVVTDLLAEPLGIQISHGANVYLTLILTVVSFTRSYLWRRYFSRR